jgi:hypothetical protein
MTDFNIGKGVYVWQPAAIEDGDPERIAARFKMAGVQTAAVKVSDGFRVLPGNEALIQTLRNHGIRVGAWGYSYLNRAPLQEAHVVADACHQYTPDFYLIDVEAEVEGNHGGARMFMNELRPLTAGLPLGLNSFWNVGLHPTFPWVDFLEKVDFVCPQVYWRGTDPVGKLRQSQQDFSNIPMSPRVPMPIVAGDMFTDIGAEPTPAQVLEFLAAVDSDPFIHGVLMWAADDSQTTPALWQAFSSYQWRNGAQPLPTQPLGWAKIKATNGMWIRSSPLGAKVGALTRDELAPVWSVTDTKWAAITQGRDQWVYVGDSRLVDLTLGPPTGPGAPPPPPPPPPPPSGTMLYQARVVPRQGLNVRDAIGGRVLRALPVHTIVRVFETQNGWARINPMLSEWVNAGYLSRISPHPDD